MNVEFPDYPGLSLSRDFEVVVLIKEIESKKEIAFWEENYKADFRIVDQQINLGCGEGWNWEVPYPLNDELEKHTVRVRTVRRG